MPRREVSAALRGREQRSGCIGTGADPVRKRYKAKLRSCGLCKPHKRGIERRWKPQGLASMRAAEREIREAAGLTSVRIRSCTAAHGAPVRAGSDP